MNATQPCYTCGEPIEPSPNTLLSTFNGEKREVCRDCAKGIHDGLQWLREFRVTGEFLGPCPDNQPEPPKE